MSDERRGLAPDQPLPRHDRLPRAVLVFETVVVLALSLGKSGVYALVSFVASATATGPLRDQHAVLNGSLAPGRPWLDLTLQLLALGFGVVPVVLAGYLMARSGDSLGRLLIRPGRLRSDLALGVVLACGVGATGLAFYLVTHALGVDLTVVAAALPAVWWRVPVLLLSALQNALLEECVVVGYLITRLRQIGVTGRTAVVLSALLRGSYHLYQGLGGFFGNTAMGLLFGWVYLRWGRITPLVIAHTLLDVTAFVGYTLLINHVSWLP